ncbi:MAG: glutamate synthase large subunit [Planctomycetota bacterium]
MSLPPAQHLYDPGNEHDACGIGFIAHIKGQRSHAIVADALEMLARMDHRGGCGCEANTGDGAGILTAVPHKFLRDAAKEQAGIDLPERGRYGVGNVFLPRDKASRAMCKRELERIAADQGLRLLGWRKLPQDPDQADVGPTARTTEPWMEQVFLAPDDPTVDSDTLERLLFITRKLTGHAIKQLANQPKSAPPEPTAVDEVEHNETNDGDLQDSSLYYVCSLSSRVIIYKGQLLSTQVPAYYADLRDERYMSHLAMVHSRFSTNTFPSWERAQPCRWMSHNGEINTLRGNVNWMKARQGQLRSEALGKLLGDDTGKIEPLLPIINDLNSDSGTFDNVFELLLMAGRSVPEAAMMMIPEAWENHDHMPPGKRDFYAYHANLLEPWDGPASVGFTDGRYIGATLDRNGLRPSRYYLTDDDRVIMASEVGVVDVDPKKVVKKGRLQPGRMFLVDFEQGRIIADDELKREIASQRPYGRWLKNQQLTLDTLPAADAPEAGDDAERLRLLQAFGYTHEHIHTILKPMVNAGKKSKEALGSMGNDAALAVLSDKPRLLADYFKQLFAQVTNPPIDPLRETIIMSLATSVGPQGNLLDTTEAQAKRLRLQQPVLTDAQLAALKSLDGKNHASKWSAAVIDLTFDVPDTADMNGNAAQAKQDALTAALQRICDEADAALTAGHEVLILSDRGVRETRAAIPSLLAVGGVHHHLVRNETRTQAALVLESAEPREVHHYCTLFGYGLDAVNPYLAHRAIRWLRERSNIDPEMSDATLDATYAKSIGLGLEKVMSKMGISTLASYKGAQIFEAVGLSHEVIDRCFAGTASRIAGADFGVIAEEVLRRHRLGFPQRKQVRLPQLPNPGEYAWRPGGETHGWSPQVVASLQAAARTNSRNAYEQYAQLCNDDAKHRGTLRGLMTFNFDAATPIPLEEVEPAAEIVKRFRTGAMSLGALSKEAHETLAVAMNDLGGRSNSGEGGEDPVRFTPYEENGKQRSKRSAIKQIASGRFGVTSYYLANADVLQIKIAQGAKPGEGGQLPGFKVDPYIAKIRHSTPGVGLISPPPHHDIYSIEDLAQLIYDLKRANTDADVSVKLVAEVGVGTVAAGVSKAKADHILVSGADGGTGASPLTSIKHAGLPWELGIAETHQTLVLNDLRSRVALEADGGFKTGRDVVIAALLGAEQFGFSTAPMITVGCIMMRKCHLNTCPVGVCTQDPELRKKFTGTPEHVINFLFMVAEEARTLMAQLGCRTVDELVGHAELLKTDDALRHWKARGLDLSSILAPATKPYPQAGVRKLQEQAHDLHLHYDRQLLEHCAPALENREHVRVDLPITNLDRTVGTTLSYEVSKRHGQDGLPDGTIELNLRGSAGQSLGAWLAKGITLTVTGDANDYCGKGLSGGTLVVKPPADQKNHPSFRPEDNIVVGNVALYGATGGEAYFRGVAAERFCVRNSGAKAVVEGVGDHGLEYMTGGRAVILGPTGRNFAAGMSGGVAYVLDRDGDFENKLNAGMVDLEDMRNFEDQDELRTLLENHLRHTGSTVAASLLADWSNAVTLFRKVMPVDYRRVLETQKRIAAEHAPGTAELGLG